MAKPTTPQPTQSSAPTTAHRELTTEPAAHPGAKAKRGHTVFVAEDDPDLLLMIGEVLADSGLRPVLFPTALMLLDALNHDVPSVIVTDLIMPDMSGAQLLRALRREERWLRIPVIVITGSNDTALPLRLDVPVVFKPDTNALLDVIQTLVSHGPETTAA
jgi:two-component system chemotaxis response regulator CheY